jgi:hypothetical protein
MKYVEIISENKPTSKGPHWQLDIDNKVYIVFDENGKEYSRHTFQHVWDSSPAKRAAQKDTNELLAIIRKREKEESEARAEAKPLSSLEQMYQKLDNSVKKYQRYIYPEIPEDDILDKETRDLYIKKATEWLEQMNKIAAGGTIRQSLINGTYNQSKN